MTMSFLYKIIAACLIFFSADHPCSAKDQLDYMIVRDVHTGHLIALHLEDAHKSQRKHNLELYDPKFKKQRLVKTKYGILELRPLEGSIKLLNAKDLSIQWSLVGLLPKTKLYGSFSPVLYEDKLFIRDNFRGYVFCIDLPSGVVQWIYENHECYLERIDPVLTMPYIVKTTKKDYLLLSYQDSIVILDSNTGKVLSEVALGHGSHDIITPMQVPKPPFISQASVKDEKLVVIALKHVITYDPDSLTTKVTKLS